MTLLPAPQVSFEELTRDFRSDARLDEVFIFLTLGAGFIATLGLLSNSPAVVIGAMLVAPWILPLRAASFAILHGLAPLALRALATLGVGVGITIGLSWLLGLLAVLVSIPVNRSEVMTRTTPNLVDLAIALAAGFLATYGKVRTKAVSSLAGTAIAVALVPPVCAFGLLLSGHLWQSAQGAFLLFLANLLGILSGGLLTFPFTEKGLWHQLWRSRLGLVSLFLTGLLLVPLTSSFLRLMDQARRDATLQQIQQAIAQSLRSETITLGQELELLNVTIDWTQNPPLIRAFVRVTNPLLPTPRQVAAVQAYINSKQPIRYRLVVQKASIDVIGPEPEPNPEEVQRKFQVAPRPPAAEDMEDPTLRLPPPPPPPPTPGGEPEDGSNRPATGRPE